MNNVTVDRILALAAQMRDQQQSGVAMKEIPAATPIEEARKKTNSQFRLQFVVPPSGVEFGSSS